MRGGGNGYIILLDAVTEEEGLDDVLRRRVIGVELTDELHELCKREDFLAVSGRTERDLGEEVTELHELGEATRVALSQRIHRTAVTCRRLG